MRMRRLACVISAALFVLGLLTATLIAVRLPMSSADFAWIWGLKARAIHRSGELASVFRVDPAGVYAHPEYPLLWPLLLAGVSTIRGTFDELFLTLLRPGLLVVSCLIVARTTRAPAAYRIGAAAALSLLPYFRASVYVGYAEALLLLFLLAAAFEAERLPTWPALVRCSVFLALAAGVKREGALAAIVAAAAMFALRHRKQAIACLLIVFATSVGPWELYRRANDPEWTGGDFSLRAFSIPQLLEGLGAFARHAARFAPWIAGGVLLVALAPRVREKRRALLWCAGTYTAVLMSSYAFSTLPPAWHVDTSWDRLVLIPIAVLIPVFFEAGAECASGRTAEAPHATSPSAVPLESPVRAS